MKTILLPTDFSDNSWNAIEYAINFYRDSACTFYLLHVNKLNNDVIDDYLFASNSNTIVNDNSGKIKNQLKIFLKKIAKKYPNYKNHHFSTIIETDSFIESIRKHTLQKKVDIIVMGTKGASGLSNFIIGTNTSDVITKVKSTILVIPENAKFKKVEEVAFPTDFSLSNNLQLLQPITDLLEKNSSSLRILNISKKSLSLDSYQQKRKQLLDDYFYYYKHSFHFLTNEKVENAVQSFVKSSAIDMIAMVAKNLNYFQQILFHNKVEEISYHTDIPFLVLHE
ncbi:universal stress protein [uncultured Polaribacter sp.]|uniref:universal stress protein n=1 Tax=uncultured Polaribacter sp. TaxID=174711 RepID=UPI0026271AA7|nr:universal stress protein [uncultured Polaribacter sp.]